MPVAQTGQAQYTSSFTANGLTAGFDVNQMGYGETVASNQNIRPVPWANPGIYVVSVQVAGYQPITRVYQIALYAEAHYGALRSLVGAIGMLITPREGPSGPGTAAPAILTSIRRGGVQNPAWPSNNGGGGGNQSPPSVFFDFQTAIVEFTMLG